MIALGGDQAPDHRLVPQRAGGVVGVGQVQDGGAVLRDGGQHGGFVELEIGRQRHAVEGQALQLRAHGVHHEARQRRQDGRARNVAGHGQQADQLVRAVAQHQRPAGGRRGIGEQRGFQLVDPRAGVAVDGHRAQAPAQLGLQPGRQAVGVLHGVELEHAGGVLHGVGVHALHVGADAGQRIGGGGLRFHLGRAVGRGRRGTGRAPRRFQSAARAAGCR